MDGAAPPDPQRRAELAGSLDRVRARIAGACQQSGRDPAEVTLIAVTKTYPATDVAILAELGAHDLGESRDQEAKVKVRDAAALTAPAAARLLRWHFVGRVQTNKCKSIARYASAVHSVDRVEVADSLAAAADRSERVIDVFVQVSLDDDPNRGGTRLADLDPLADAVAARPRLTLRGVMAVAPLGADPDAAFARLSGISERLRQHHPAASAISAGMSEDFESAIKNGATHVRVGSALLGRRSSVFG